MVISGCARTGVPARRGSPLRQSRWVRLGRWIEALGRMPSTEQMPSTEVPLLSRKVEELGTRMELWNTRIEAAPGLHWLAA